MKALIISFFWGDPVRYIDRAKEAGAMVVQTVGTPEEARRAVDLGADVIVAQGNEAGGHVWSRISTMVLVPLVAEVAGNVPVLAAGGIADGRGLAAALALGAPGAMIGTRFLASPEAAYHVDPVNICKLALRRRRAAINRNPLAWSALPLT